MESHSREDDMNGRFPVPALSAFLQGKQATLWDLRRSPWIPHTVQASQESGFCRGHGGSSLSSSSRLLRWGWKRFQGCLPRWSGKGRGTGGGFCYTEVLLAGSPDKEPSESYLPSPATHREGGEAWPLSDSEPADPVPGRGRRVAGSCPEMRVLQESLHRECESDKEERRASLAWLGVACVNQTAYAERPPGSRQFRDAVCCSAIRSGPAGWPAICPQPSFHLGCIKKAQGGEWKPRLPLPGFLVLRLKGDLVTSLTSSFLQSTGLVLKAYTEY